MCSQLSAFPLKQEYLQSARSAEAPDERLSLPRHALDPPMYLAFCISVFFLTYV